MKNPLFLFTAGSGHGPRRKSGNSCVDAIDDRAKLMLAEGSVV